MKLSRWFFLALLLTIVRPDTPTRQVHAERPDPSRPRGPNLLILIGDDHRADLLGIDGDPRKATPNLDRLARQGTRFRRAYCNAPVCTASRQSFITGRYPHAVGVTVLSTPLPEEALTLGDWLTEQGYVTGAIGKMHFNGPSHHGFSERIDAPEWNRWLKEHPPEGGDPRRPWRPFRDPAAVWLNADHRPHGLPRTASEGHYFADQAVEFLQRHKNEPFALVVSFYEPHSPFVFPREWEGKYRPEQFDVPPLSDFDRQQQPKIFKDLTPEQVQGIQAAYFTALNYHDYEVGRVLDALDASGHADDTIVVYWGDNGYLLGEHGRFEKHVLYEPGVHVPLIVRWPGHIPAGRSVSDLVEMVDVFPTLLTLMNLPSPPDLHGRSLQPLLEGQRGARGRDYVFSEYLENEEAMIRSDHYKLIIGTGARARQDGYITDDPTPGPYERLYDLKADPNETTDLREKPELAPIATDLRRRLHDWLVSTREGQAPVPEGLSEIEAIHWCLVPRDAQDP